MGVVQHYSLRHGSVLRLRSSTAPAPVVVVVVDDDIDVASVVAPFVSCDLVWWPLRS